MSASVAPRTSGSPAAATCPRGSNGSPDRSQIGRPKARLCLPERRQTSWPPHVATGRIGTPVCSDSRTAPVLPGPGEKSGFAVTLVPSG
jgi:hypothetical protein